ncbi:Holliday junction branch migration protein RuvA [Sandarakinorhabdus oryzae]|uniref:Holliday junction branch migration protein RuvA n=1 Tax=Sandarakinorhabdus oryzae TaxID=2675220 RepID=UPI0012E10D1C|nr:Holliday junction branch migration protein RuvA [Sandarakinorhabdus oryzae]
MIARLKGLVDSVSADALVMDVNGVGYLVQASTRTLATLSVGQPIAMHIETQVREDAITLFGCPSESELAAFRALITVQGVGGRVALNILSVLTPDQVAHAVAAGDAASLARANGVGPKLAARIANELNGKMGGVALVAGAPLPVTAGARIVEDAVSALAALGFKPMDASRAVSEALAELGEGAGLNDVVRVALKKSAR